MNVPMRLRRLESPEPITGLLLPGADAAGLVRACARLTKVFPPVYAVTDGFLIRLPAGLEAAPPGTLALRSLADHFFLPADADLEPHLLREEAVGLTRQQGLLFLPGGRVLAYDPTRPLRPSEVVSVTARPGEGWRPLPRRPAQADRLTEVLLDRPDETPDSVLAAGGDSVGQEAPRPTGRGQVARLAGEAAAGAARGLLWLGNLLGWKGLARLGARVLSETVRRVPRVSETVLGRQEAALRELLRQFREGDLEEALRRALPLGGAGGRGGTAAQDAHLPWHNLLYNLRELLGTGKEPASVWMGGANVRTELETEYRRVAEAATRRGDYRRAAFVYAKLLQDYRLAADVLARGGLHHDAAVLYLDKLGDGLAAARCFEAGGEIDRALQLYRQANEYVLAGDLLRRAGELELALREYQVAADQLVAEHNHLAAGELFLQRANRTDLARAYFEAGWASRPHGSALACLQRLLPLHAARADREALLRLAAEADELFGRSSLSGPALDHQAGQFYNALAGLAGRPALAELREELLDRSLRGLTVRLRQRATFEERPGSVVATLFEPGPSWPASLVRDAEYAFKSALRQRGGPNAGPTVTRVRTLRGRVTAACAAATTGDLYLGFESGGLVALVPRSGAQLSFPAYPWPVTSLATTPTGDLLLVLRGGEEVVHLHSCQRNGADFSVGRWRTLSHSADALATPLVLVEGVPCCWLWAGTFLVRLWGADFLPNGRIELPFPSEVFRTAVILPGDEPIQKRTAPVLVGDDGLWLPRSPGSGEDAEAERWSLVRLSWLPERPAGSALLHPVVSWLAWRRGHIELAGLGPDGMLFWEQIDPTREPSPHIGRIVPGGPFRAAALLGPGRVAAVAADGIHWVRMRGAQPVQVMGRTAADLADAVACFASVETGELLVVCAEGDVVRVPLPA